MNNEKIPSETLAFYIFKAGEKAQKYWSLSSAIYCDFNPITVKQTLIREYNIPEITFQDGWDNYESVNETCIELSTIIRNNKVKGE